MQLSFELSNEKKKILYFNNFFLDTLIFCLSQGQDLESDLFFLLMMKI